MDSLGPVSHKHQDWFDENDKEIQELLEENTKNTKHTSVIPAQYLVRLPIQTYVRQFRLGSETCKSPGWAKKLMKMGAPTEEKMQKGVDQVSD